MSQSQRDCNSVKESAAAAQILQVVQFTGAHVPQGTLVLHQARSFKIQKQANSSALK